MSHTKEEWKCEVVGTGSGQWLSIYVDDPRYQGEKRELFESATVQINTARTLKKRWKDTQDADEIRANVALVLTAKKLLNALKAIKALLPEDVQLKVEALILEAETPAVTP